MNEKRTSLKRKLLISHMTLASLGVGLLMVAFGGIWFLRQNTMDLALQIQPQMEQLDHVSSRASNTLVPLRAFISEKEEGYSQYRKFLWSAEINPVMERLEGQDFQDEGKIAERLRELKRLLVKLEQLQDDIEAVAISPMNEPARYTLDSTARPILESILASPSFRRLAPDLRARVHRDLRASLAFLENYVTLRNEGDAKGFAEHISMAMGHLRGSPRLSSELARFKEAASYVFETRDASVTNQAEHLLRVYSTPLEAEIQAQLHLLEELMGQIMNEKVSAVLSMSLLSIAGVFILIVMMIFVALLFSVRTAERITEPVAALQAAAKRFSFGDLSEGIPEIFEDELGDLTITFNQMRQSLLESYGRIQAIFEAAADGIFSLDTAGRVSSINESGCLILGLSQEELLGRPIADFMDESSKKEFVSLIDRFRERSEMVNLAMEVLARSAHGRPVPLKISLCEVEFLGGKIISGIFRDVSDEKSMQQKLIDARDRALGGERIKSTFLANMSHEIRTPMNGIIGMTELTLGTELTPAQRRYIKAANEGAKALLKLLNDILDLSKLEGKKMELERVEFCLAGVFEEAMETFLIEAQKKHLDLNLYLDAKIPERFLGDPTRLRQVLMNLLGNAVKFTPTGEVLLKVIPQHVNGKQHLLCVSVIDTGIGVAKERLDKIFESFTQSDSSTSRKFGGTGLGTTISKELVHLMGGDIWIESEIGRGTQVHFTLPLQALEGINKPKKIFEGLEGKKVLLVDESASSSSAVIQLIRSWGFQVDWLEHPSRLFEVIAESKPDVLMINTHLVEVDLLNFYYEIIQHPRASSRGLIFLFSSVTPAHLSELSIFKEEQVVYGPFKRMDLARALAKALGVDPILKERLAYQSSVKKKVLVAEDNEVNRLMMKNLLKDKNLDFEIVTNGKEALDRAQKESYDLILMDVQMPVMDGLEATLAIRDLEEAAQKVPIVAMTAVEDSEERQELLAAGMNEILLKPFEPKQLDRLLRDYLNSTDRVKIPQDPRVDPATPELEGIDMVKAMKKWRGEKPFYEALRSFLRTERQALPGLQQVLEAMDFQALANKGHALYGASANIAANKVAYLAKELEIAAKERNEVEIPRVTENLIKGLEDLFRQIESLPERELSGGKQLDYQAGQALMQDAMDSLSRGEGLTAREKLERAFDYLGDRVPEQDAKKLLEEIDEFDFAHAEASLQYLMIQVSTEVEGT